MHLTGLDLFFWAAGFFGHVSLLVVLFVRHRAATFPLFTVLIANDVIKTISLYSVAVRGNQHTYLIAYIVLTMVDILLQIAVIYEMSSYVFRPLGKWATDVRAELIWAISFSIVLALALTWLSALPPTNTWLRSLLLHGNFFSAVLMAELFAGMLILSVSAGLPWKTHVARIAQGLGFYSFICILIESGHSYFGMDYSLKITTYLSYIRMLTYLICLAYWIVMLWLEAPTPRTLSDEMRTQLVDLQAQVAGDVQRIRMWRK